MEIDCYQYGEREKRSSVDNVAWLRVRRPLGRHLAHTIRFARLLATRAMLQMQNTDAEVNGGRPTRVELEREVSRWKGENATFMVPVKYV